MAKVRLHARRIHAVRAVLHCGALLLLLRRCLPPPKVKVGCLSGEGGGRVLSAALAGGLVFARRLEHEMKAVLKFLGKQAPFGQQKKVGTKKLVKFKDERT